MPEDCSTCKHHSTSKRPKVISEVYDTLVEFADEDETVYHCRSKDGPRSGQEVGPVPVRCDAYEAGQKGMGSSLADAVKRWQDRDRNPSYPHKE